MMHVIRLFPLSCMNVKLIYAYLGAFVTMSSRQSKHFRVPELEDRPGIFPVG